MIVKLSDSVAVNKHHVIAIKLEDILSKQEVEQPAYPGSDRIIKVSKWLPSGEKETVIYTSQINGEYSDNASLMCSDRIVSPFDFDKTIQMFT